MGGPSWALDVGGVVFGCDPAMAPIGTTYPPYGKRTVAPAPLAGGKERISVWLLTHNHADHIDEQGLALISADARIIAHPNLEPLIKDRFSAVTYLNWGEKTAFTQNSRPIIVRAIPAFHGSTPEVVKIAGGVNGYLVTVHHEEESCATYVTGDTVADERIYTALNQTMVDVFIPNMGNAFGSFSGGPVTLSMPLLMEMIERIKPVLTVPVHIAEFDWWEMSAADLEGIPNLIIPKLGTWVALP